MLLNKKGEAENLNNKESKQNQIIFMGLIIFILIIVGFIYWKGISEPAELKQYLVGKTNEQQDVIKYFYGPGGFLTKRITDQEYDSLVATVSNKTDFKQRAINKFGIDESEVQEIKPVNLLGYKFAGNIWSKKGKDGVWRSSAYEIAWIFCSSSQLYAYKHTFNMDENKTSEKAEEYFYKDITNLTEVNQSVESKTFKSGKVVNETVDSTVFSIAVPGIDASERFTSAYYDNDDTKRALQGLKSKLREKKS